MPIRGCSACVTTQEPVLHCAQALDTAEWNCVSSAHQWRMSTRRGTDQWRKYSHQTHSVYKVRKCSECEVHSVRNHSRSEFPATWTNAPSNAPMHKDVKKNRDHNVLVGATKQCRCWQTKKTGIEWISEPKQNWSSAKIYLETPIKILNASIRIGHTHSVHLKPRSPGKIPIKRCSAHVTTRKSIPLFAQALESAEWSCVSSMQSCNMRPHTEKLSGEDNAFINNALHSTQYMWKCSHWAQWTWSSLAFLGK